MTRLACISLLRIQLELESKLNEDTLVYSHKGFTTL